MSGNVLILGARGKFGRNAAQTFSAAGWNVTRFDRAMDSLSDAVKGMDVIVNAWNPPDYSTWAQDLLPMHQSVIDAVKGSKATIIVPGNVYVFGPETPMPWSERSRHGATNPLGQVRIQMEQAYKASGLNVIILRAGDFLDTEASGNWFDLILVKKLMNGAFTYPGPSDIPHAWAYLPDMARAAVELAEKRETLPAFADIPFPGYTLSGTQMSEALERVTGAPLKRKRMAWWPLAVLALFSKQMKALREMRYLWNTPHALDGAVFREHLPDFKHTPVETALATGIRHLNTSEAAGKLAVQH